MQIKAHQLIIFIGGFFLFCTDQFLKFLSQNVFTHNYLLFKVIGWNPFLNTGIAFSLPVSTNIAIALSIPILFLILYFLYLDYKKEKTRAFFGLTLLFFGALSNLLDRIIYDATRDYWLLGTGVINLADIMIVLGIYLLFSRKHIY